MIIPFLDMLQKILIFGVLPAVFFLRIFDSTVIRYCYKKNYIGIGVLLSLGSFAYAGAYVVLLAGLMFGPENTEDQPIKLEKLYYDANSGQDLEYLRK